MSILEADAKLKHCVQHIGSKPPVHCVGSACMAWVWEKPYGVMVTEGDKPERNWAWDPTGQKGYENCKVRPTEPTKGDCRIVTKAG